MDGSRFVESYYTHLGGGDLDALGALYGADAEIVRYDGVSATPDEIRTYHADYLRRNGSIRLQSIDQIREADDVLMWDASVETDNGILQAVHVVVFADDGTVRRHIPGMRGFWGQ